MYRKWHTVRLARHWYRGHTRQERLIIINASTNTEIRGYLANTCHDGICECLRNDNSSQCECGSEIRKNPLEFISARPFKNRNPVPPIHEDSQEKVTDESDERSLLVLQGRKYDP